jgi:hypothetical protein
LRSSSRRALASLKTDSYTFLKKNRRVGRKSVLMSFGEK